MGNRVLCRPYGAVSTPLKATSLSSGLGTWVDANSTDMALLRSLLRRDESKFSGATGLMVSNSHGRQRVEFSGLHILRELPVPCLPIELRKPSAEHRELLGRHPLNFGLDPLNATHILTPACHAISSQQPATGPALRGSA